VEAIQNPAVRYLLMQSLTSGRRDSHLECARMQHLEAMRRRGSPVGPAIQNPKLLEGNNPKSRSTLWGCRQEAPNKVRSTSTATAGLDTLRESTSEPNCVLPLEFFSPTPSAPLNGDRDVMPSHVTGAFSMQHPGGSPFDPESKDRGSRLAGPI